MVREKVRYRGAPGGTEPIQRYTAQVAGIPAVKQVLVSVNKEGLTIWTLIDAPPFEDKVRVPIYEAELEVLRGMPAGTLIDFHVLNLAEYAREEEVSGIIPPRAREVWHR